MTDIRAMFANQQNGSGAAAAAATASPKIGGKSIEKIYQKKSQLEHILLRPDTYIGSVEMVKEPMWIFDKEANKMVQRDITYVPGLYKIFDEILVNAADNKQRDPKMSTIKVEINQETNTISVWNDGHGIPVVMHKEEKMYVPTMIFGHLLTSSNYNDEEEKVTGGRNGYGAKLCNIFSTKFTVETASKQYKKCFKQTWGDNMSKTTEPKIKEDFFGNDYTKITFSPDLSKFKMEKLDDDIVGLLSRRAYDVAASTRGVSVYLNGTRVPVKNFKDYIDLFLRDTTDDVGAPVKMCYESVNERWEVAVAISERGFQQVSFVNSIATTKGGRHVDYVSDMIVKQLIEVLKKKNKGGVTIKPFQVKNHMWVFINCLIVNPTFDSQTKENMTLQSKSFGSKCALSEKFITAVSKSGIVESVLQWAKFKAQTDLAKTSGSKKSKIKGIPKLEDANDAGSRNSLNCTLILTEGDSAKTLAVSGLGVVGRDTYGVFPLRGKLLNVREATHKQILENAEINNLIKILGLQYKKKYLTMDDLKTLRYGKVMIMTDQDQDGSHIKGLLINFIHTNWPELLRLPFLEEFITPIVKATKKNGEELSFFSLPEFEEWKAETANSHTYNIKYYKGLGTSTSKEAKEYFQNMERHRILFRYEDTGDDDAIMLAFSKKAIEQRKDWLTAHMEECRHRKSVGLQERYLYTKTTKEISYKDFVNLELVLFSNSDNVRSIPCMLDGLKPGQRKVLYTCFKRDDKREVKVAQLAGSVAEKSAYHHGEMSLCSTIINLAQNYVGSNNINLLYPGGQFGTRLTGGKDSASPRYIFTMLSALTRHIFHPLDDPLLEYQYEDNQRIEPVWYLPIIPMLLINGADGIGTGWATKIPNHNPRDVIANIRRMLNGDEPKMLTPWYKNFRGVIESVGHQKYLTAGTVGLLDGKKIEISELPIGTWTQTYKENVLEPLLHGSDKAKAVIADYKEYNTDTTVRFVISFLPGEYEKLYAEEGGFHRLFKLTSSISTASMNAFDDKNYLKRYAHANEIFMEFYTVRLDFYGKRRAYLLGMLQAEADSLSDKARFIMEKCNGTLVVENKKRKALIDELIKRGYRADPIQEWKRRVQTNDEEEEDQQGEGEEEEEQEDVKPGKSTAGKGKGAGSSSVDPEKAFQRLTDVKKFNYLLGMSMWMLTEERKNEILKQRDQKLAELKSLEAKTVQGLWMDDLDALSRKLDEVEEKERLDAISTEKKLKAGMMKASAGGGRAKAVSRKTAIDDTKPSVDAEPVQFRMSEEMIKRLERAVAGKVKKEKKEPGENGEEGGGEMDEFDALVEGGTAGDKPKPKPRVKKEPKDPKAPKAPRAPRVKKEKGSPAEKGKRGRKKKATSSDEEDAFNSDLSGDDFASPVNVPTREKTGRRAAAAKKVNYSAMDMGDDGEDDDFNRSDDEMFDNNPEGGRKPGAADDSDVEVQDAPGASVIDLDDDDDSSPVKKKPGPVKKRALGPKATETTAGTKRGRKPAGSSSETDKPVKKAKKKVIDSEEEDSPSMDDDDDSDF
ncbi:DNA topoisomerase 2 [Anopheles gambiae]|uniref:DNA topoisomerase 2 n=1 Tax=Anopheles gambiae TaxID=7165 RepID=UPI002AC94653|nr:DNA topoisomerase 2 [Anopheles gambiae]XP_061518979.1 DNA topoisomerase 2 [Anopheles gambiae]XP_061518980.1 DNA topoisomerase 2 [Anopheles gambiae]XP_061518981.1 DNA topoisomerase 2 [Anopheles gambiae]